MKNVVLGVFVLLCTFGCTSNVAVESKANDTATYDSFTGNFKGYLDGTAPRVFKAAQIAAERDMGYYRTGVKDDTNKFKLRCRTKQDELVYVVITQKDADLVEVEIDFDGGDLMKSQLFFNAIVKARNSL